MRRALGALCLAVAIPAAASSQELAYSGSLQLASGTYIFPEATQTYSLQNGLTLTAGGFRFYGSIPLILQNSSAVTTVGDATLPTGGSDYEAVGSRQGGGTVPMGRGGGGHSRALIPATPLLLITAQAPGPGSGSGSADDPGTDPAADTVAAPGPYELSVGDPFFSAAVELFSGFGVVRAIEVLASAKAPLTDIDSGVGTGEWDYSLGASGALAVAGVYTFLDATYWHYGDLPGLELRDGISLGGGLGIPISSRVWVSAMASRSNRIIPTAEPASSIAAGLSYTAGGTSWSLLAGTGLSETAAGLTVSLGWRFGLGD